MKIRNRLLLSLSSACLMIIGTQTSGAQSAGANSASMMTSNSQQAAGFVPATVELNKTLDARKDQAGASFETTLKSTVHLKDGTELPKGTVLEGKVATADRNAAGAQLALEFTDAKLKNGKDVPIQATIVGFADPIEGTDPNSSNDGPIAWDGTTTQFDVSGAVGNVELHSKIGGDNSGTLIASGKSDFKLNPRSRLSLALGEKSAN